MESDRNSWEQNALINELIQGMEIARKLKEDLSIPSSDDTRDMLLQRILSSYEKALIILKWRASVSKSQTQTMHHHQATKTWSPPESPVSINRTPPRVEEGVKDRKELKQNSKKRKTMTKWVDRVSVKAENGFEGPHEDGYNWRKYGQKDILRSKYPRSYYRCTFRKTKGCWATKQVQRSDEDPTMFDITYRGKHTCSQAQEKPHGCNNSVSDVVPHALPSQESLAITEFRNTYPGNEETAAYQFTSPSSPSFGCMTQDNHTLFPSILENDPFLSSFSHMHLLSPEKTEPNHSLFPSFVIDDLDGVHNEPGPDSDITRIISANTSATDSPIFDFNFSLDALKIDTNFPFNAPGF